VRRIIRVGRIYRRGCSCEDETEQLRAESRMLGVKMSKIMMNGGGIVCDILIGFKTNIL
jgi:hypothetical protein